MLNKPAQSLFRLSESHNFLTTVVLVMIMKTLAFPPSALLGMLVFFFKMRKCQLEMHSYSPKDLDSNTHAILFLNDNNSPMSINPLPKSHQNIQMLPLKQRKHRYEAASQIVFSITQYLISVFQIIAEVLG